MPEPALDPPLDPTLEVRTRSPRHRTRRPAPRCASAPSRWTPRAGTPCPPHTSPRRSTAGPGPCRTTPSPRSSSAGSTWRPGRPPVAGTSADGTSTTTKATRSSSTGERTSPGRSTGRPGLEPMDVTLRRRFGFERGVLTAYEDEHLVDQAEAERRSAILASEIERPRTGPMRDIVATIQPEQDVVVRTDLATSVCVQGAPGTGKTAVGLHRAAWLLYAHRDRLAGAGCSWSARTGRSCTTSARCSRPSARSRSASPRSTNWSGTPYPIRAVDPVEVATLKGDARMAEVLYRAVWSPLRPPRETPRRHDRLATMDACRRTSPAMRCTRCGGRGLRYAAGRAALPQRLAHEVLCSWNARARRPTTGCRTRSLGLGR